MKYFEKYKFTEIKEGNKKSLLLLSNLSQKTFLDLKKTFSNNLNYEPKHFLNKSILENFRSPSSDSVNERVLPSSIIWIFESDVTSWNNEKSLGGKRKSTKEDLIVLNKIKWPDWNVLYVISGNWNHRVISSELRDLPYVNAQIYKYKFDKMNVIDSNCISDFVKKIECWLVDWIIDWNILIIKTIAFDWALMKSDDLKKYVDFYESIYPDWFSAYKDKLCKYFWI